MNKPMNTAEFFTKICGILKEKDMLPDILECSLEDRYDATPIKTINFDIGNNLDYGGSEGIYLDIYAVFYEKETIKARLGTFKTLHRNRDAMYIMAKLLADFVVEATDYVNAHMDDFTWTGYDVDGYNEDGKWCGGYSCATQEAAQKRKEALLAKYPRVVVRDNATRKQTEYIQEEK